MVDVLVAAAAGFAASSLLALAQPRRVGRQPQLVLVLALATGFGVAGALASPAATGVAWFDGVLRAALCAATVLVAASANAWLLALAAALALPFAGSTSAGRLAAAALGVAIAAAAARLESPPLKALAAGLVTQAALRLDSPDAELASAAVAAAVFAVLALAGLAGGPPRLRRTAVRAAAGATVVAGVAGLLGVLAAALARPHVEDGIRAASAGLHAARGDDPTASSRVLATAARSFADARRQLDAWWARPALAVPVVARQTRALQTMAASGASLSRVGARSVGATTTEGLEVEAGAVPLERILALRAPAREAFTALAQAEARLAAVRSPWLVGPVSTRLDQLAGSVHRARADVRRAMVAFDVAPALLGSDGPRRYFLAIQTPSELRGSGGFIGNFGEIAADQGRLTLERVGRTADLNEGGDPAARRLVAPADYTARYARFDVNLLWQNITMSPDFPTVGRAIASLYPQSGGRPVDGVVAIDPLGLAGLLRVIGPVDVKGWPVPLTGDNAAQVLLFEQYVRLDGDARVDFLGRVTQAVWDRLTTTSASVVELARAMGPLVAQKHVQLSSTHPQEERALLELGVAGAMAPVRGDFVGVVTQNASANKIDWFLRRSVDYRARLDPATGQVAATTRVTLRNEAPTKGLPPYVIGNDTTPPLPPGTNKLYLSVYSPLLLTGARLDGRPLLMESELERGRHVYSTYVVIPPGGTSTVELDLSGTVAVAGDGYRLDLHRQPFLAPDVVTAGVEVPAAWRVGQGEGAGRRWTSGPLDLTADRVLRVPVAEAS